MIRPRHIRLAESLTSLDPGLSGMRGQRPEQILRYLCAETDALWFAVRRRPGWIRRHATAGPFTIWMPPDWGDKSTFERAILKAHELSHGRQWRRLRAFGLRYAFSPGFQWAVEVLARRAALQACYALGFSKRACRDYAVRAADSLLSDTYRLRRLGRRAKTEALRILMCDVDRWVF